MATNKNIEGKGFDKRPENINRKGRPRKLISFVNTNLKKEGYKTASLDEVKEAYLTIINLPLSKIMDIARKENDEYPLLYKLIAKELTGKRGAEMLEKVLDRALGKAIQSIDHTTQGKSISLIFESANGSKNKEN
jgi:hypothetical protein